MYVTYKKPWFQHLPTRARLSIALAGILLVWWLYVLPRDLFRVVRRVCCDSASDAGVICQAIKANTLRPADSSLRMDDI